ncbi:Lactate dehydrogenase [Carabus blaptoides fortunei]
MTTSTLQALLAQMSAQIPPSGRNKIAVIGAGSLGSAVTMCLVAQRVGTEIVLIDKDITLVRNELQDIKNSDGYMGITHIEYSTDIAECKDSKIIVITAGKPMPDTVVFDKRIMKHNVDIYLRIIPEIMAANPRPILIVVTSPVDLMSQVAWKLSGLPNTRVIGTGCCVLSKRFRQMVGQKLGLSPHTVQALVLGENSKDCIPLWNSVSVCGIRLRDINKQFGMDNDPEHWTDHFKKMLHSNLNIIRLKKDNIYGLAGCVAHIATAIIQDSKECFTVSTHLKGCRHGNDKSKDVFLSMPCILGSNGVQFIVRQVLTQLEKDKLQETANKYKFIQSDLVY